MIDELPMTLKEEMVYFQFGSMIQDIRFLKNIENY